MPAAKIVEALAASIKSNTGKKILFSILKDFLIHKAYIINVKSVARTKISVTVTTPDAPKSASLIICPGIIETRTEIKRREITCISESARFVHAPGPEPGTSRLNFVGSSGLEPEALRV